MKTKIAILNMLFNTQDFESIRLPDTRGTEPVRYGRVLLSTPLPAYTSPHLLNVLTQIANKLGFKKKKSSQGTIYSQTQ
jgi:hypothetical protein